MLYWFMYRVVRPLLRIVFRPVVVGLENVPEDGAVILASNHLSFVDSVLIPLVVPRRVTFIAKAEYFEGKGAARILGSFLSAMGHIPVPRTEQRAAVAALDIALGVLNNGNAFAIYPEGTRSEDGRLYRGHTGVGWLALNAGASVVPVAVKGTEKIMPVGAKIPIPRLHRPGVKFGKPIDYTAFADMPPAKGRRAMVDEIMKEIQKLSRQEYAGVYNERSKQTQV
ncbi:lysophospholipid acyltransferase family protein [Actinoallomurus rhizosphaericola]|uniref:lysophospholipid acyltransferase family protein n=1 Tax=Actinoallomurus rhizosphaericola TaxID=2952536 RepID=UPI002090F8AE|nr:lysophospholipid acyltransferase family protein [Actinoallomurus rhizosphaericola]MCO5993025.1 1-acyl-sn-glycerol-3-phosphate acyltransferase [Actinoallomurus rhizosphaericola]